MFVEKKTIHYVKNALFKQLAMFYNLSKNSSPSKRLTVVR